MTRREIRRQQRIGKFLALLPARYIRNWEVIKDVADFTFPKRGEKTVVVYPKTDKRYVYNALEVHATTIKDNSGEKLFALVWA